MGGRVPKEKLYEIDFDEKESRAVYDPESASVTYGIITVSMDKKQYQDGTWECSAGHDLS